MKHWDKFSLLLALLITWLAYRSGTIAAFTVDYKRSTAGSIASIAATMLGFLIAALAILASIAGQRLVRNMQRTGHYTKLLKLFFWSATAYLVTLIVATSALVLPPATVPALFIATCSTFVFSGLMLFDIGYRFWLVLSNLTSD
jgi:hypothetical protein